MASHPTTARMGAALVLALASAFAAASPVIQTEAYNTGSVNAGSPRFPAISSDGRYVAYTNRPAWDASATGNRVYIYDRATGTNTQADLTPACMPSSGNAFQPSISADGRYVAFASRATDMGLPVGGGGYFLYDRITNTTKRLFSGDIGVVRYAALSANGQFVAYRVAGTPSGNTVIHVYDIAASTSQPINGASTYSSATTDLHFVSDDGRYVGYRGKSSSAATQVDLLLHDRSTGSTELVNVNSAGERESGTNAAFMSMSSDGKLFSFATKAANLSPDDTGGLLDVFVRDRQAGTTERISYRPISLAASGAKGTSISADGRFVTFEGYGTATGSYGLYQYDRYNKLARKSPAVVQTYANLSIAASGRYVVSDCLIQPNTAIDQICIGDYATPFGLTLSAKNVEVTEGGDAATYTAVLDQAPDADVLLTINPDAQLGVAHTQLTFTPQNWNTPQTISVQALPNNIVQGTHSGLVRHAISTTDPQYTGIPADNVAATILDGVVPTIVLPGASAPAPALPLSGSAAPGATVLISANREDGSYALSVSAVADAEGNWSALLQDLAPGTYLLQAVSRGIESALYTISIQKGIQQ